MDPKSVTPGTKNISCKRIQRLARLLAVDTQSALDGYGYGDCLLHGGNTTPHKLRLQHQAGAKCARLHPVQRAADIEVDLVIAIALADTRSLSQLGRITAAQLQRHWPANIIFQQIIAVAMNGSISNHHFGI